MRRTQGKNWFNWKRKIYHSTQITHALPISWNEILRNYTKSINNLVGQDHHLIKKHQILSLNKLNSATLYVILVDANKIKPTSETCSENIFSNFKPDWKSIYLSPRCVILNKNLRMFQYKLSKVMSTTFVLVCFLSLNECTCQTRKNVFYFTLKALFVLEKIRF